ncbi:MAG TPA: histidine phosphatase family protein [Anaerolineaceae bacterium]|nr:histidine phosphatase family protein [Anaerolineaceae bacterium]
MEFYYIRHAQSTNNALYAETGSDAGRSEDPELSPLGLEQAERLAHFIKNNGLRPGFPGNQKEGKQPELTHLYTSLMVRAVRTGSAIARALDIPIQAIANAHECGGIFLDDPVTGEPCGKAGKSRSYFAEEFPNLALPEIIGEDGWWNRPFEVEEDRLPRAHRFLGELLEKHGDTDDRVAVVSHGGFYNEVMTALMDLPKRNGVWFTLYNTAITRIDFIHGHTEVVYQNRTDFLPRTMVT